MFSLGAVDGYSAEERVVSATRAPGQKPCWEVLVTRRGGIITTSITPPSNTSSLIELTVVNLHSSDSLNPSVSTLWNEQRRPDQQREVLRQTATNSLTECDFFGDFHWCYFKKTLHTLVPKLPLIILAILPNTHLSPIIKIRSMVVYLCLKKTNDNLLTNFLICMAYVLHKIKVYEYVF